MHYLVKNVKDMKIQKNNQRAHLNYILILYIINLLFCKYVDLRIHKYNVITKSFE